MGLPFVVGDDHEIVTKSTEFTVVTVVGGSGIKAQSSEILFEYVL